MAKLGLSLLAMSLFLYMVGMADSVIARHSNPTDFIKASCRVTSYPAVCVQCLAGYARAIQKSERQLAQTALTVSLARVRSAKAFVTKLTKVRGIKPREYQAVKDCRETMGDSIDRLCESIQELRHIGRAGGQDFLWHVSNVETWVSAALTDENTCLDGFSERSMNGNVKTAIRRRVVNVAQVTSNALALVTRFASNHKAAISAAQQP